MSQLRAIWMPHWYPQIEGLNKEIGNFWVSCDERQEIEIRIVAPSDEKSFTGYFASFNVHYDGIETLRELDKCGFLKRFEETKAQTFYDVFYCLHASGIPVISHDSDQTLIANRTMYELLTKG